MGSWSVYCGISNITIHEGDEALLVVLEKAKKNYNDFDKWKIVAFPIFGSYNDYGRIGYIKEDFNTALIEKEYQCSIEDFCHYLLSYEYEGGCGNLPEEQAKKVQSYSYMWIKKDVWDFIINHKPTCYGRCESFDFGNEKILNKLGLEYVGENQNDSRYKRLYKHGKKYFKSDGTWLHGCLKSGKDKKYNENIFRLNDLKKALPNLDVSFFENKEEQHILGLIDDLNLKTRYLSDLFNIDNFLSFEIKMAVLCLKLNFTEALYSKDLEEKIKLSNLLKGYIELLNNNDDNALSILANMVTLKRNCYHFSKQFEPYVSCITPQCGEDKSHLNILKGFAKILEKTISENEDED